MFSVNSFLLALIVPCVVDAFVPSVSLTTSAKSWTTSSQLSMTTPPSRRELFQYAGAATVAAASSLGIQPANALGGGSMTEQSAANKANESYQGVYYDPKHPDGYRILRAVGDDKAVMTLSDEGTRDKDATTYRDVKVAVNQDELVFDFGFKGGPKNIKGKLSADKQSIAFEDGNVWTKNYRKYDGIYKVTKGGDPSLSKDAYRILRKNGPEIIVEMCDTGNPKDTYYVDGSVGSLFSIPTAELTFYFGGKTSDSAKEYSFMDALYDFQRGNDTPTTNEYGGTIGKFSLQVSNTVFPYGTITFPDKTVWTRI